MHVTDRPPRLPTCRRLALTLALEDCNRPQRPLRKLDEVRCLMRSADHHLLRSRVIGGQGLVPRDELLAKAAMVASSALPGR